MSAFKSAWAMHVDKTVWRGDDVGVGDDEEDDDDGMRFVMSQSLVPDEDDEERDVEMHASSTSSSSSSSTYPASPPPAPYEAVVFRYPTRCTSVFFANFPTFETRVEQRAKLLQLFEEYGPVARLFIHDGRYTDEEGDENDSEDEGAVCKEQDLKKRNHYGFVSYFTQHEAAAAQRGLVDARFWYDKRTFYMHARLASNTTDERGMFKPSLDFPNFTNRKLPYHKCVSLLNHYVGPLGWSDRIDKFEQFDVEDDEHKWLEQARGEAEAAHEQLVRELDGQDEARGPPKRTPRVSGKHIRHVAKVSLIVPADGVEVQGSAVGFGAGAIEQAANLSCKAAVTNASKDAFNKLAILVYPDDRRPRVVLRRGLHPAGDDEDDDEEMLDPRDALEAS